MSKIIINIIVHDGITSLYTGVGRIAYDIIRVLSKDVGLRSKYFVNGITCKYTKKCLGYDPKIKSETKLILRGLNGKLYECSNGSNGSVSYGNIDNWKMASKSATELVQNIVKNNLNSTIVNLCLDTPFAHVPKFLSVYKFKNVRSVWIPHSTVLIHKVDSAIKNSNNYLSQRLSWEKDAIDFASSVEKSWIGYIGVFMKKHLVDEYGVKTKSLVNFKNGLNISDSRFDKKLSQRQIRKVLQEYGIPTDKKLLFSFGRLEPYKGFEATIKIGGKFDGKVQTVLISQPYTKDDPNVEKYQKLMCKYNPKGIFLHNYKFNLPHALMQWHNSHILLVPSMAEPLGLIPEEARLYKNKMMRIICSNTGGFPEQINNKTDGFLIDLKNLEFAYKEVFSISKLSETEISKINEVGYNRAILDYDLKKNLQQSLSELISA